MTDPPGRTGRQEAMEQAKQRALKSVANLAARGISAAEIADILGLELEVVRQMMSK
jgi:hypothetical protein